MRLLFGTTTIPAALISVALLTAFGVTETRPAERSPASDPRYDLRTEQVLVDDLLVPRDAAPRSVVDDRARPASLLSTLDADTLLSPGIAIGITSYDSQHNASQQPTASDKTAEAICSVSCWATPARSIRSARSSQASCGAVGKISLTIFTQ